MCQSIFHPNAHDLKRIMPCNRLNYAIYIIYGDLRWQKLEDLFKVDVDLMAKELETAMNSYEISLFKLLYTKSMLYE